MKTINGNNKYERMINKTKKYLNIDLKSASNKYWEITNYDQENTFVMFIESENLKANKAGDLWIIRPINWKSEKPIFVKQFAAIKNAYWNGAFDVEFIIFQVYNEEQRNELKEVCKGCEDVFELKQFIEFETKEVKEAHLADLWKLDDEEKDFEMDFIENYEFKFRFRK